MKSILLLLFFILSSIFGFSQTDSVIYLNTDTKIVLNITNATYNRDNNPVAKLYVIQNTFEVYQTSGDQFYVVFLEDGGPTRRYLGWLTPHIYCGMTVFCNIDMTKFHYLQLDEKGIPKPVNLPDGLFTEF